MKATASRAIASTDVGVLPSDAPMPWLSKTMTRRLVAMPSTTRGSHLSSSAARWLRKMTGTPVPGPSCRYTNFVPPTSMRLVGAFLHVMLDPGCDCACMLILPSKGIVAELTDQPRAGLVRDANDHFSDGAAGFHVGDGLGRSFKRKDLVQDRLNDTLFRQRSQSLQLLPARVHEQVLETHVPFPRQAIDLAIQEPEEPDQWQAQAPGSRELAVGPAAERHHHAARPDHLERAEQRVAPLRVEDHVLILDHRLEAARLVIDGHIRAERLYQRMVLSAGRSRDLRAEVFGQLDGDGADAARAGMDQDLLARPQPREFDQRLPGGKPHQRQRRGLRVVEARGLPRRGAFAHQGILGEGADAVVVEARIDRIAELELGDAWSDRFHIAGEIGAEDQGEREGEQHLYGAVADLVVERVDAGGAHAHQQLARARFGPRQLHHFHRTLVTTGGERFQYQDPYMMNIIF